MIRFTATRPKCEKRRFSRIIILGHNWLEKRCTNWVLESIIHIEVSHGSLFVDFEAAKSSCSICKVTFLPKKWNEDDSGPSSQWTTDVIFLSFFLMEVKVKSSCWTTHAKIASSETVSHQMRRHDGSSSFVHKVSTTIMSSSKWSQYIFGSPIIW